MMEIAMTRAHPTFTPYDEDHDARLAEAKAAVSESEQRLRAAQDLARAFEAIPRAFEAVAEAFVKAYEVELAQLKGDKKEEPCPCPVRGSGGHPCGNPADKDGDICPSCQEHCRTRPATEI